MAQKYEPGSGMIDTFANSLADVEFLDCGVLDPPMEAAVAALTAAKNVLWDNADALVTQQSAPLAVSLQARCDAAAATGRKDEAALLMLNELKATALKDIAAATDQTIAQKACAAVTAFGKAVAIQETKAAAPAALTTTFDLKAHSNRVEKTRAIENMGATKTLAFYEVLLSEGNEDEIVAYETAAETFLVGVASGGTAKLVAANPNRYKLSPGDAAEDVANAQKMLSIMTTQRANRIPDWVKNARGAYRKLEDLCGRLCGNSIEFMSAAQASNIWGDGASGALPNALDVSPTWGTRYLTSGVQLAGYSPIEARFDNGQVKRQAAKAPASASVSPAAWRS